MCSVKMATIRSRNIHENKQRGFLKAQRMSKKINLTMAAIIAVITVGEVASVEIYVWPLLQFGSMMMTKVLD